MPEANASTPSTASSDSRVKSPEEPLESLCMPPQTYTIHPYARPLFKTILKCYRMNCRGSRMHFQIFVNGI